MLKKTQLFSNKPVELEIAAEKKYFPEVISFIDRQLEAAECPAKIQMQIDLAVEEVFVNISDYAYTSEKGTALIRVELSGDPASVTITFEDSGIPYDPLAREDPDITLPIRERTIGGLGIFLVKKIMDEVTYEYRDGKNILSLKKNL